MGDELRPEQYPPWPWRELTELTDELARRTAERVAEIMRAAGEDPANEALFRLRCEQAAWGIGGHAGKLWKEVVP